jgi:predicted CXXCH cytochrome family protein
MRFTLRQIARRADGGDIVRSRDLAAAEIIVGRGTDCDVQLADLGIMLRHLSLTGLADGRVAVAAIGGVPVEIGGSLVTRADLDPAAGAAIAIASHRLTLTPGEAPGSVIVTAERVIAAGEGDDAATETGVFSLRAAMPSKRRLSWVLALVVLVGGLLLPWWLMVGQAARRPAAMVAAARDAGPAPASAIPTGFAADQIWSSGPLSTAHAGLSNNCGACHEAAFVSVRDAACTACHTPAATPDHAAPPRLAAGRVVATGLVASLQANVHQGVDLKDGRCAACHKEHEGPRGALMVSQDFCTDCHAGLSGRLPDTALANVPDWGDHPQFRPAIVTAPSATAPRFTRVSLAAAPREASGLIYPHELHMSSSNAVANMVRAQGLPASGGALGCGYCHTPDSDRVRFRPIEMEKNCAACHDLAFARHGGVIRTLPHGKPQQVAGIVRDYTLSQALRPAVLRTSFEPGGFGRRLPGSAAAAEAAALAGTSPATARARADAAIAAVFAPKGVCADCHRVIDSGAGSAATRYAIAPVTLADHYLPKGRFPHGKHRIFGRATGDAACTACHTNVRTSRTSADVLLPPVATCRQCHGSATVATKVAAECSTCHGYHGSDSDHGDFGRAKAAPPARIAFSGKARLPPAAGA